MCGSLQGDSYSPVDFCLSEVSVCKLLQESKGYRMGEPGNGDFKRTHSLFVDDLRRIVRSRKMSMIVQASNDTGACSGVTKLFLKGERWLKGKDCRCCMKE